MRKKFIWKWGSNFQDLEKILGKTQGSIYKIECICWRKVGIASLLQSKLLLPVYYCQTYENFTIFSRPSLEKVKKIEAQAKMMVSLWKKRVSYVTDFNEGY